MSVTNNHQNTTTQQSECLSNFLNNHSGKIASAVGIGAIVTTSIYTGVGLSSIGEFVKNHSIKLVIGGISGLGFGIHRALHTPEATSSKKHVQNQETKTKTSTAINTQPKWQKEFQQFVDLYAKSEKTKTCHSNESKKFSILLSDVKNPKYETNLLNSGKKIEALKRKATDLHYQIKNLSENLLTYFDNMDSVSKIDFVTMCQSHPIYKSIYK